jgi:methylenetetrahydrofolate reductase (NADPH)
MSVETHSTAASEPTNGLLTNPRFELMPFESFEGQMEHLPEGATIAITTSPQLGLDATVE